MNALSVHKNRTSSSKKDPCKSEKSLLSTYVNFTTSFVYGKTIGAIQVLRNAIMNGCGGGRALMDIRALRGGVSNFHKKHYKVITLECPPPGRPVHSDINLTSLESIQPCCNYRTKNIHSHISTTVLVGD